MLALLTGLFFCLLLASFPVAAKEDAVILASTTSTENSGLLGFLLAKFKEETDIKVHVVAVGTGQAIRLAERGDADVLMVHDRASEEKFVAEGWGVERHALMHNDFLLLGPSNDPARVRALQDVSLAMSRIRESGSPFASRGDDSGTHKAEMRLWKAAAIDPVSESGTWYRETGSGMGATLNTSAAMNAYTISDRGTWLSFSNRRDLEILVEQIPALENPYSVILVNPERHPHVEAQRGQALIDWLLSNEGQRAIGSFRVKGELLFFPERLDEDTAAEAEARKD